MEGAEPGHALRGPGEEGRALPHLPSRLVGEGHRENFMWARSSRGDQMSDARRQNARFANPCAGKNENGAVDGLDCSALLVVEPIEVAGSR
jgi:hypothetical protein